MECHAGSFLQRHYYLNVGYGTGRHGSDVPSNTLFGSVLDDTVELHTDATSFIRYGTCLR